MTKNLAWKSVGNFEFAPGQFTHEMREAAGRRIVYIHTGAETSNEVLSARRFVNEYKRHGTPQEIQQMLDGIWDEGTVADGGLSELIEMSESLTLNLTKHLGHRHAPGTFGSHCEWLGVKLGAQAS